MSWHKRGGLRPTFAVVVASLATLAGCSSDDVSKEVAALNKSNIQRVGNIYAGYQNAKNGAGPKDEAEFKDFIRAYAPDKLTMMGIDANNVDALFTSERDGKPFKIRYKVGGGRGAVAPVAFEQDGVSGKKQVGFTGGKIEEVGDSEYAALWSGKSSTPPASGPGGGGPGGGGGRPGAGGPPPGAPTGPPK